MCIQLCICFCRTAFIARTSSHTYLFCSSTPSGSAVPYLDWWIISALCSAVARLVQPDCTTQLQLRICIQNAHTHTFTLMSTKHAPAVPTPSILPDASLCGGCNKPLKKQTKTKKKQQQFSITQCHLASASRVYKNCSVTRQQTGQRAKQGKIRQFQNSHLRLTLKILTLDLWHLNSRPEKRRNGAEMSALFWSGRHADVVTSMCCG